MIVRAFPRNCNIMGMTFAQPCTGNADKGRFFLIVLQIFAADISHGRFQATGKLMDNCSNRPLVRDLPLNTFRNKLQIVGNLSLEISIRGSPGHGTN